MWKYLVLLLLSLLLTACQSSNTPLAAQMPPYLAPESPHMVDGVPLYPGSVEQKDLRSRFANQLAVTYIANGEMQEVSNKLQELFIQAGFENVKTDRSYKSGIILVGRKPQVVALLNLAPLDSQSATPQTVVTYTLLLRSPGGS